MFSDLGNRSSSANARIEARRTRHQAAVGTRLAATDGFAVISRSMNLKG
jgi:hypothetical protein